MRKLKEMHRVNSSIRTIKSKFFLFTALVFMVYVCLFYVFIEVWSFGVRKNKIEEVINSVTLPYVIMHVDLKGSPPKLEYLQTLLPALKKHGVNGLLMEYEDMFPYEGKIVNISARNCYKKSELKEFLYVAAHSGFEVIPLVQTFGHLEHALKLQEFSHLRENPMYPDSLCPSKQESKDLINLMLEQVVEFHSSVVPLKHIHVGCDEVFHIKECYQCLGRHMHKLDIFIDHVWNVSNFLKKLYPDITVLIWDDMLRSIHLHRSVDVKCFDNVEPVYWDYTSKSNPSTISHHSLFQYRKKFKNIWAASAFKGADGVTASLPDLFERALNHFNWMNVMLNYRFAGEDRVFDFKGIILTGWSRYSHMDPACELLPASYPTLILSLMIIQRFRQGVPVENYNINMNFDQFYVKYIEKNLRETLKCNQNIRISIADSAALTSTLTCNFEGNELYALLYTFNKLAHKVAGDLNNDNMMDISSIEYYSQFNHINMNKLLDNINWCNSTLTNINDFDKKMSVVMARYYYDDFVREYIDYKTFVLKKKLNDILSKLFSFVYVRYWNRNPINYMLNATAN